MLNFNKYLLQEKILYDIEDDVEFLYSFFKDDIEEIERTGMLKENMFPKRIITTAQLTSDKAKKANKINPCNIHINDFVGLFTSYFFYKPKQDNNDISIIGMRIHKNAFNLIIKDTKGDLNIASEHYSGIEKEFTSTKIKGSIRHELTHWIDDTFNNSNIKNILKNNGVMKKMKHKGYDNVNLLSFEIYAILQNIYQLKLDNSDIWDEITFDEMIYMINSLGSIKKNTSKKDFDIWKRKIKRKMYKEGILGKNMINK